MRLLNKLIDSLLWIYWRSNKRFLAAFSDALLGGRESPIGPDGTVIVDRVERFLKEVPSPVFRQFIAAIWLLPVSVPKVIPVSRIDRLLVRIWYLLRTHAARARFVAQSPARRERHLRTLFNRLLASAAEEEDDLVKSIIVLNQVKGTLIASFLDLEESWTKIGYTPYPDRSFSPPTGPDLVHPPRTDASEVLHQEVSRRDRLPRGRTVRTKYCVIGSGAGGATAAYFIEEADPGADIFVLESGPFVPNDELPLHLMDSAARLYMNGAVTLAANQKYTFRQARAIGGGTLVNNSVALKPEGFWWSNIVDRWESLGVKLDFEELYKSYDPVMELLNVTPIDDRIVTTMADTVRLGFEQAFPDHALDVVTCNLKGCIGCGRCNVGCKYGAKQSLAETLLPELVRRGGRVAADATVSKIELSGPLGAQRVTGLVVDHPGGTTRVEADKYILAAGAYASTKLLWRSGYTGSRPGVRTVGKRFSGNFGSAVVARFPEPQLGWNGQQVGYVVLVPEERMIIETAFAPPPAVGLMAPQWGDVLAGLLLDYGRLGASVPVLGTLAYGEIKRGAYPSGFAIDFRLIEEDWRRLAVGMKMSAEAMLAIGATEIFSTRFDGKILKAGESVDDYFGNVGPLEYLSVETAHLQGGNVTHPDPNQGVVDGDLKVHGVDNLWIMDASVIPAPITLNIQLTVMALARYGAPRAVAA